MKDPFDELSFAIAAWSQLSQDESRAALDLSIQEAAQICVTAVAAPVSSQPYLRVRGTVIRSSRWGGLVFVALRDSDHLTDDGTCVELLLRIPVALLQAAGCEVGLCRGPWDSGLGPCQGPCCVGRILRVSGRPWKTQKGVPGLGADSVSSEQAVVAPSSVLGREMPCTETLPRIDAGVPRVLFEDEDFLAVDKPANQIVHTGKGKHVTAFDLVWQHRGLSRGQLFVLHRLDKDTSGVLLFGKTRAATSQLGGESWGKNTRKEYLALVNGLPERSAWVVDLALEKLLYSNAGKKQRHSVEDEPQQEASTGFEVLAQLPASNVSLLRCELLMGGRRHQIRRHLQHCGHSIAGDPLYGNFAANRVLRRRFGLPRIFLHHWCLQVWASSTGPLARTEDALFSVKSTLPPDLAEVVQQLSGGSALLKYCR